MMKTPALKIVTITVLFLLYVSTAFAQGLSPLMATVDRTSLSTDETLNLTVTVSGTDLNPPAPTLPTLAGFSVVGRSTSSQVNIINGDISAQSIYSYRLQPTQSGELTIDPISLTLNGQTYTTDPIKIQVTQGSGGTQAVPSAPPGLQPVEPAPAPGELTGREDFFVEAEMDNPNPYVGQQVVYTFRFYQGVNLLDQPHYEAPNFNGFWSEEQPDQGRYTIQIAGRQYRVTELHTILFPTAAGSVTIEQANLTIPGGFFSRDTLLQTKSVKMDVKPLPPNAPASFNGAVGQFTLTAKTDVTEGKVNEPITLRLTLEGQGNLNTVPDPTWPEISNWRSFESQATTNTQVQDGQLTGSRVYERLYVPGAEGEFTIPPIEYTYFDPEIAQYKTLSTEPIAVSIAPGAAEAPEPVLAGSDKEAIEYLATDIRHLKPAPTALYLAHPPLTEQSLYWLAWGVPLLAIVGNFTWQWRQQHLQANPALVRSSKARKRAKKALIQVKTQQQDPYSAAGQVLNNYLGDKLNRPVAGLTQRALANLLTDQNLNPNLIEQIKTCLTDAELGRFSPEAGDPTHADGLLKEIGALIDRLDKTL